jgi:hypothetical protein
VSGLIREIFINILSALNGQFNSAIRSRSVTQFSPDWNTCLVLRNAEQITVACVWLTPKSFVQVDVTDWMSVRSVQDYKCKEVTNWTEFSIATYESDTSRAVSTVTPHVVFQ